MGQLLKVAEVKDVPPGSAIAVELVGHKVALFNVEGRYHAIDDTCTHRGGPLSEGALDGTTVTCPWHGARFDVRNGNVLGPPAAKGVGYYPVRVDGSDIKIEVPS
jgi:nitrite reductase/ring-hydroxylating ferredoxin subunit